MITDYESFLAGVQVGRRLRLWDAVRKPAKTYLTFESIDGQDFSLSCSNSWDGIMYYSTDAAIWHDFVDSPYGSCNIRSANGKLYVRGIGNTIVTGSNLVSSWRLSSDSDIRCEGNIETLLDWKMVESGQHPPQGTSCYYQLFTACHSLITAPELPAITLAESCYALMFMGTAITQAPRLPAMTLASNCYKYMFANCYFLTAPPILPALTLADGCYENMFLNDSLLSTAPNLPATTLANNCYAGMFYGCTSLTTAPNLPAMILANSCYDSMFEECTSLTTAPNLPATTAASYCYARMFYGCISLQTSPTTLPATKLASYCYYRMFYGCEALIIPPSLPAITLNSDCYNSMFYGCISLTTLPELPAITLVSGCYNQMFRGCRSLGLYNNQTDISPYPYRIPTAGQGTGSDHTFQMFSGTSGDASLTYGRPNLNTTYYVANPPISTS